MATGSQVVNVVRDLASDGFQAQVPEANATNSRAIGEAILEYDVYANEFVNLLVNRIAFTWVRNKIFKNKLSILKKGDVPLGTDIQDIYTNPANPVAYDMHDLAGLLRETPPETAVAYYRRNRQDKFPVTINNDVLEGAFVSWEKFEEFLSQIVNSLYSGNYIREFNIAKQAIVDSYENGYFTTIEANMSTKEGMEKLVADIQIASDMMETPSSSYNKYKELATAQGIDNPIEVTTWTPKEDQIIIISSYVKRTIGVKLLASLFNMSQAEFEQMSLVVDSFDYDEYNLTTGKKTGRHTTDIGVLLADKSVFQYYQNKLKFTTDYIGSSLTWQYWLHAWDTYGICPFANALAVKITSEEPQPVEEPFQLVSNVQEEIEVVDGVFRLDYIGTPPTDENLSGLVNVFQEGNSVKSAQLPYDLSFDEENKKAIFTLHSGISYDGIFNGETIANVIIRKNEDEFISVALAVFNSGVPVNYYAQLNPEVKTINVTDITTDFVFDMSNDVLPQHVTPEASLDGLGSATITCVNLSDSTDSPIPDYSETDGTLTFFANSLTAGATYNCYVTIDNITKLYVIEVADE